MLDSKQNTQMIPDNHKCNTAACTGQAMVSNQLVDQTFVNTTAADTSSTHCADPRCLCSRRFHCTGLSPYLQPY